MTLYDDIAAYRKGHVVRTLKYVLVNAVIVIAIVVTIVAVLALGGWVGSWFGWGM